MLIKKMELKEVLSKIKATKKSQQSLFLFHSFLARSPVFSAMFEHEMEESKKVS